MGIAVSRIVIGPDDGVNFDDQLTSCFKKVNNFRLLNDELIIQLSFFIYAVSNHDFTGKREKIRLRADHLNNPLLPISVIAQAPANGVHVQVEICIRKIYKDVKVDFREEAGVRYTVVESKYFKEIYSEGIADEDVFNAMGDQIDNVFIRASKMLKREGFTFANVVRQWNYIENILETISYGKGTIQNYQLFNNIRTRVYGEVKFNGGFPAATGIGMSCGGFVMEICAVSNQGQLKNLPLRNPRQYDAYNYSESILTDKGANVMFPKTTPKFERARFLESDENSALIYISGTASIENEQTTGVGDVRRQALVTINNIEELISTQNLINIGIGARHETSYSFIRVYIKDPKTYDAVREVCDAAFKNISVNYVVADVCRHDLLLEIEGIAGIDFQQQQASDGSWFNYADIKNNELRS